MPLLDAYSKFSFLVSQHPVDQRIAMTSRDGIGGQPLGRKRRGAGGARHHAAGPARVVIEACPPWRRNWSPRRTRRWDWLIATPNCCTGESRIGHPSKGVRLSVAAGHGQHGLMRDPEDKHDGSIGSAWEMAYGASPFTCVPSRKRDRGVPGHRVRQ